MISKATTPELKQTFESHLGESQGQIDRLEKVFAAIGERKFTHEVNCFSSAPMPFACYHHGLSQWTE